jgi:hypothetical protein
MPASKKEAVFLIPWMAPLLIAWMAPLLKTELTAHLRVF